ncbi:MAG TPA: 1,4-alpha-glucan branching protein GlgB [Candidatus Atribacteria bacterium]|nr:1,4-alpha-glucan branching protein GlgB [Candidatus Atribacteria bacterium]
MSNSPVTISKEKMESIINADCPDPFSILGMHPLEGERGVCVRVFIPAARKVKVIDRYNSQNSWLMNKVEERGFFELALPGKDFFAYLLEIEEEGGTRVTADAYSFLPFFSEFDLHLFNEGTYHFAYERLGAHLLEVGGIKGAYISVWAPNARRVSVVGDFNHWDGRVHQMRVLGSSGVWEIFIPQVEEGAKYKFEIKTKEGSLLLKSDPYAFFSELRPATASIVYHLSPFPWQDEEWMESRKSRDLLASPWSIYEVHLGSWKRGEDNSFLNYRDLAHQLVAYVKEMGFTHIELLPIAEHPFDASWGYQVTGYFAPTSRFGTPQDFQYFVDYCHREGIGVILDWVIAHFPKDAHGLGRFDGTALYEHLDPRRGEHPHWGSYIFNYGRNEVRTFLVSNAFYWLREYHIDALRVDAVASMLYLDYGRKEGEWMPNPYGGKENLEAIDFLHYLHENVYYYFPGIATIAEESTAWPGVTLPPYLGGLGFLFKWNMGWMNDFLTYISKDPIHRKYHHQNLTFPLLYAFSENFILPISHDEVVHGKRNLIDKMPGDWWQKFANVRLSLATMLGYPGKKLLFMGTEFGQWREWNHDEELDWFLLGYETHRQLQKLAKDLNHLYTIEKSLFELDYSWQGFEWIDCNDADNSVISFIRKSEDPGDFLVFVCNFTPVPRFNYQIGVPREGFYQEILNTDSEIYGGSNLGNWGGVWTESISRHGQPFSLNLTLPPLGSLILKWRGTPGSQIERENYR